MADTFFDFNSNMPGLGPGKVDASGEDMYLDNDLNAAAAEDDEIDLMNEETFGNAAVKDDDWEETHDKLAQNVTKDSGFDTAEKKYRTQEEFMEQSISHMVLEDEEDEAGVVDDPAVVNASRTKPIPMKKRVDLDELFGPASPPALYEDIDHIASPSHQNIWGSPSRQEIASTRRHGEDPIHNPIHNLLERDPIQKLLKSVHDYQDPSIVAAGKSAPAMSTSLPGKSSSDIERDLKQMLGKSKTKPLTVEELERDLKGGWPTVGGGMRYATGEPHPSQPPRLNITMARAVQMNQANMNGRMSPVQLIPTGRISPIPPNIMLNRRVSSPSPPPVMMRYPPPPTAMPPLGVSPVPMRMISPMVVRMPGGRISPNQQMINNSFGAIGRSGRLSPTFGPRYLPRMPMSSVPGMGLPPMAYTDPRDYMRNRPPPPLRFAGPQPRQILFRNNDGRGGRGRVRGVSRYHIDRSQQDDERNEQEDEYAGMMSKKEKDWVIKIQLLQLQTENPYLDDYYFTAYMMKKMAADKKETHEDGDELNSGESKLILPHIAKVEGTSYKPAQFEGSLGRLTASSVHNPRKIIDCHLPVSHHDDEPHSKRYKQLLIEIEKCYNIYLEIDDLEKKILALPEDGREVLTKQRKDGINDLYDSILPPADSPVDDHFVPCLCIRKGKKIVARSMLLLNREQNYAIAAAVLKNFAGVSKKDKDDNTLMLLYGPVSRVVKSCDQLALEALANLIVSNENTNVIQLMLQNKFGASLICCMMGKSESICQDVLEDDPHESWVKFISDIGKTMLASQNMCQMSQEYPGVREHFNRVIDPKIHLELEDKIEMFLKPS